MGGRSIKLLIFIPVALKGRAKSEAANCLSCSMPLSYHMLFKKIVGDFRLDSRARKWAVGITIVVGVFAGAYFIGTEALRRYLVSRHLLDGISEKSAEALDEPTGYLPLTWRGLSVSSQGLLAKGRPKQSLTELRASNLTARINLSQLWERKLKIDQLSVEHFQAAFGEDAARSLTQDFEREPNLKAPIKSASDYTVHLSEVVIGRADLRWGKKGASDGALRDMTARFWPVGKNLVGQGYGGTFEQHGFPRSKIAFFQIYYAKPVLSIDTGTLQVGKGQLDVHGEFAFTKPGSMKLDLDFKRCATDLFLDEKTRSKFEGVFGSHTIIKQEQGPENSADAEGEISVPGAILKNIEALDKIASLTSEPRFRKLRLQRLSGKYVWKSGELAVSDFEAEAEGIIRLEGEFQIKKENIHGKFQLGVSEHVLNAFPGAREEVFKKERDGYFWTTITIRGPIKSPKEDLKERLVAAAEKYYEKKILSPILKPGQEILKGLKELFQ